MYEYYDLGGGTVRIGHTDSEGKEVSEVVPMNDPRVGKQTNFLSWMKGEYTITLSYAENGVTVTDEFTVTVGMSMTTTATTTTTTTEMPEAMQIRQKATVPWT